MKKIATLLIISSFAWLAAACAPPPPKPIDPENLYDLETLSQPQTPQREEKASKIRIEALKETALSLGAQGGLAVRSKEINAMLATQADKLDRIFNFNGLMLNHSVQPPILEESGQSLNLQSDSLIRISDKTYKIVKQAKFVTAVPNWRDYLWMDYKKPELPDHTLLPRDDLERRIWVKYVYKGWLEGIAQANSIYMDNLARLKDDFNGMLLYRQMLAKHMINLPFIAKSYHGITSNASHTEMRVNDQTLQMMSTPRLTTVSKYWNPVVVQDQ